MVVVQEGMGVRLVTTPSTVCVSLAHLSVFRHSLRSTRVSVSSSSSIPRLVSGAAAAQAAGETSPPLLRASSLPSASAADTLSSPIPSAGEVEDGGPIELSDYEDPFAFPSAVTPLQTAASVVFTGGIAFLLYRALQRRLKLAKETKVRSSGLENVNEAAKKAAVLIEKPESTEVKTVSPPSAWKTFQGALVAGGIAFVLYNFTTYVEAGFASKPVSSVYTVRQLTITIRTIINGLCYLATFVFAANSIGLFVYTLQLLLNLGGPAETIQEVDDKRATDQDPLKAESSLEEVKKD